MKTATDHRLAKRWYIRYDLDAYAIGPLEFKDFVGAGTVSDRALHHFGERPNELWPDGEIVETDEYEYEVAGEAS